MIQSWKPVHRIAVRPNNVFTPVFDIHTNALESNFLIPLVLSPRMKSDQLRDLCRFFNGCRSRNDLIFFRASIFGFLPQLVPTRSVCAPRANLPSLFPLFVLLFIHFQLIPIWEILLFTRRQRLSSTLSLPFSFFLLRVILLQTTHDIFLPVLASICVAFN